METHLKYELTKFGKRFAIFVFQIICMKHILIVLLLSISVYSCKKADEVKPIAYPPQNYSLRHLYTDTSIHYSYAVLICSKDTVFFKDVNYQIVPIFASPGTVVAICINSSYGSNDKFVMYYSNTTDTISVTTQNTLYVLKQ